MKKETAINRAEEFLRNLPCILLDESVPFENYLDFSEPDKPYYVYMDAEARGCFENEAKFMTAEEVNSLIKQQMMSGRYDKWDHICIFDIKNNEIVYPRVGK
jgi:hypothetical protein